MSAPSADLREIFPLTRPLHCPVLLDRQASLGTLFRNYNSWSHGGTEKNGGNGELQRSSSVPSVPSVPSVLLRCSV
jgi:hypothetical protein